VVKLFGSLLQLPWVAGSSPAMTTFVAIVMSPPAQAARTIATALCDLFFFSQQ
jgi:hypothetical protein